MSTILQEVNHLKDKEKLESVFCSKQGDYKWVYNDKISYSLVVNNHGYMSNLADSMKGYGECCKTLHVTFCVSGLALKIIDFEEIGLL